MSNKLTAFKPLNPTPKPSQPQRTVLFGFDENLEVESSTNKPEPVKENKNSVPFSFDTTIEFSQTTMTQVIEEKSIPQASTSEKTFSQEEFSQLFGNTFDTVKDAGVNTLSALGTATTDTIDAGKDLFKEIFGIGAGEQKAPDKDKDAKQKLENMALKAKTQEIQASLQKAHQEFLASVASDSEIESINKKVGFTNTSYRGIKNSDGSIRLDINTILQRQAAEQITKEQREKSKAAALAMSSKKAVKGSGPSVNMNTALEDQNMNRPG